LATGKKRNNYLKNDLAATLVGDEFLPLFIFDFFLLKKDFI
jgi:hypothetical protein